MRRLSLTEAATPRAASLIVLQRWSCLLAFWRTHRFPGALHLPVPRACFSGPLRSPQETPPGSSACWKDILLVPWHTHVSLVRATPDPMALSVLARVSVPSALNGCADEQVPGNLWELSREPLLTKLPPPLGFGSLWRTSGQSLLCCPERILLPTQPGPLCAHLAICSFSSNLGCHCLTWTHIHSHISTRCAELSRWVRLSMDHAGPGGLSQTCQGHPPRNLSRAVDRSVLSRRLRSIPLLPEDNRRLRESRRCIEGEARLECELSDHRPVLPPPPPLAPSTRVRAQ